MQDISTLSRRAKTQAAAPRSRSFEPVMHLSTAKHTCMVARSMRDFEETVRFSAAGADTGGKEMTAPAWLALEIESFANSAHASGFRARPILVRAPAAALGDRNTAIAAAAAIKRTRLCPQEICIEFSHSAVAQNLGEAERQTKALRRKGFRVSVDATESWDVPVPAALRILIDSMRIDAKALEVDERLQKAVSAAVASGVAVIAENAAWRDGEFLNRMGVSYATRPRSDA